MRCFVQYQGTEEKIIVANQRAKIFLIQYLLFNRTNENEDFLPRSRHMREIYRRHIDDMSRINFPHVTLRLSETTIFTARKSEDATH